ncbi:hypothetical protein [Actinoalloteichus caeruleus]|uniref:hypothetical protein n=1 Tax=Actinoalloteichus cyanogriseus TaxID=2893586 RepID=UPI003AAD3835
MIQLVAAPGRLATAVDLALDRDRYDAASAALAPERASARELEGADTVLLVPPAGETSDDDGGAGVLTAVVDAALAAGVRHVVYLSVAGAPLSPLRFHAAVEERLDASPLAHTVLRLGIAADVLAPLIRRASVTGELVTPAAAGRLAAGSRRDYAEAAVVVAAQCPEHRVVGELTGASAFTMDDVATEIGAVAGRNVAHRHGEVADVLALLAEEELPPGPAQALARLLALLPSQALGVVSPHLAGLLPRPPATVREIVRDLLVGRA